MCVVLNVVVVSVFIVGVVIFIAFFPSLITISGKRAFSFHNNYSFHLYVKKLICFFTI